MKSLLESIFGGRENIIKSADNAANDLLWKGIDEALELFDKACGIGPNRCSYYKDFYWVPRNENNIFYKLYGKKNMGLFMTKRRICAGAEGIIIELMYDCDKFSRRRFTGSYVLIKTGVTLDNYRKRIAEIINALKMHPEFFIDNDIAGSRKNIQFLDFKNKYIK